jgi:DNA-directed RNA polymerase subunit L
VTLKGKIIIFRACRARKILIYIYRHTHTHTNVLVAYILQKPRNSVVKEPSQFNSLNC